jgi:hypothetical protein
LVEEEDKAEIVGRLLSKRSCNAGEDSKAK